MCCLRLGYIELQAASAESRADLDVVIYSLVRDLIRVANKSWGEPTDGPIYPKGNLVRGNSPITAVCVGVCVCVYFQTSENGNSQSEKSD